MVYTDNNSVSIIGRISKDAVVKQIKDDFGELTLSFCSNSQKKNKDGEYVEKPNFFIVKLKGSKLDKFASILTKGKQISVKGMLQQDSWEKDGQKQSLVYILAEKIQPFSSGKSDNSSQQEAPASSGEEFPEDIPF